MKQMKQVFLRYQLHCHAVQGLLEVNTQPQAAHGPTVSLVLTPDSVSAHLHPT